MITKTPIGRRAQYIHSLYKSSVLQCLLLTQSFLSSINWSWHSLLNAWKHRRLMHVYGRATVEIVWSTECRKLEYWVCCVSQAHTLTLCEYCAERFLRIHCPAGNGNRCFSLITGKAYVKVSSTWIRHNDWSITDAAWDLRHSSVWNSNKFWVS